MKHAPAFNKEISLLEINGTMTILHTDKTKNKPIGWSASEDWKEAQDLLEKYAKFKSQPDVNVYFSNEFLSEPPYLAKRYVSASRRFHALHERVSDILATNVN